MRTAKNLRIHELIGLHAQIANSSCRKWIDLKGKIVDETKNLLVFETEKGEVKIQKISSAFLFTLENGEKVELKGKDILFRPEERTKKAL
ncbi:MAG: ribonuclease P protein subunit [Candidatus ainarchaeum sp.]|nr:ribonuclease P protein subunit [Candidatus ainarchaeum sp.]